VAERREAQRAFCAAEYPRLVGSLTLVTGRRDIAEEIAQEALTRAMQHWRRVEAMAAPGAWVHRVAINLANSTFTRRRLERAATERLDADRGVHDDTYDVPEKLTVRAALASIPVRQRTAVVLRYFADLSIAEVAVVMKVQEGTVKALTHQGVAALRTALGSPETMEVHDGD
jgi:RNA polymerase sigma-70 factor (ECF subfamily)